ncbi:hypothetical protein [Rhodohalobacter mucosus]|uniref:Transporter n=1 Tax=Rhodohalobacter mucosus TaxID=2079485 RepID=A0A316TSC4_9BACT|nr:hypothetical protein [Rhodohalobacter mucosus]PWN06541.1 hypothetical protein DDZ15_08450 [Rhodohalobacter mucosus]
MRDQGHSRSIIFCIVFLLGFMMSESTEAQSVRWQGSSSYSSGTYYFTEKTGSFYVSNGLSVEIGSITGSFSVPYVVQSTPWVSYAPAGNLPTGGTQSGEVKRSGKGSGSGSGGQGGRNQTVMLVDTTSYSRTSFSDPSVSLSVNLLRRYSSQTFVYLNTQLKIPVSDPASGYGTGAWDGGAGLAMSKGIGASFMLFTDLMYWWMGDMEELPIRNGLSYGIGFGKLFTDTGWTASLALNGFTGIIEGVDPPLSLSAGAGVRLGEKASLNVNAGTGLSESSPDITVGLGWFVNLF